MVASMTQVVSPAPFSAAAASSMVTASVRSSAASGAGPLASLASTASAKNSASLILALPLALAKAARRASMLSASLVLGSGLAGVSTKAGASPSGRNTSPSMTSSSKSSTTSRLGVLTTNSSPSISTSRGLGVVVPCLPDGPQPSPIAPVSSSAPTVSFIAIRVPLQSTRTPWLFRRARIARSRSPSS